MGGGGTHTHTHTGPGARVDQACDYFGKRGVFSLTGVRVLHLHMLPGIDSAMACISGLHLTTVAVAVCKRVQKLDVAGPLNSRVSLP